MGKQEKSKIIKGVLKGVLYLITVGLVFLTILEKLDCLIEVSLPVNCPVTGVILADEIRDLDWNVRKASFVIRVSKSTLKSFGKDLIALIIK